jgi:hypothetical protein
MPLDLTTMRRLSIVASILVPTLALGQRVSPAPLSPAQLAAVERGEAVQVLETIPTSSWPKSTVFQFIDASPEEGAAVLADYELQAKYIPRMKSARVMRRAGRETDVAYLFEIPVYPDERSISRQHVTVTNGEYRVLWHTVAADSLSKGSVTTGSATFTAMTNSRNGRKGTLMTHQQSVVPASMFAKVPFVRNKAIEVSRESAQAIARQVERERTSDPALLKAQVARLREMLEAR